jgi:hypothetical protein
MKTQAMHLELSLSEQMCEKFILGRFLACLKREREREREREFYRIQNVSRLSHDSRKKSKRSLIRILAL